MPRWTKNQSGNPNGRPPNAIRYKSLRELFLSAQEFLSIRAGQTGAEEYSAQKKLIEEIFNGARRGNVADTKLFFKLSAMFLPRFDYSAPPESHEIRWIQMELTQDIVDGWHEEGLFPPGTPRLIADISKELLNQANDASLKRWCDE